MLRLRNQGWVVTEVRVVVVEGNKGVRELEVGSCCGSVVLLTIQIPFLLRWMPNAPRARIVGCDSRIVLMDLDTDNRFKSISSQHTQPKISSKISGGIVLSATVGFMLFLSPAVWSPFTSMLDIMVR